MKIKKELLKEVETTSNVGYQIPTLIEVMIDIRDILDKIEKRLKDSVI